MQTYLIQIVTNNAVLRVGKGEVWKYTLSANKYKRGTVETANTKHYILQR